MYSSSEIDLEKEDYKHGQIAYDEIFGIFVFGLGRCGLVMVVD
jgi:hypothetical protein